MKRTCEECGGKVEEKTVDYIFMGENLGKFKAEVCTKCNEQVFDEDVSKKITEIAKEKGLFGLYAKTRVSILGNSMAITINKKIADFLELKKGKEITIYPKNKHQLIIDI